MMTVMRTERTTTRAAFGLAAAACAALLGYGYYLQHVQGLEPCPLCLVQRGFFYLVMGVSLVAALHGPRRVGTVIYAVMTILSSYVLGWITDDILLPAIDEGENKPFSSRSLMSSTSVTYDSTSLGITVA